MSKSLRLSSLNSRFTCSSSLFARASCRNQRMQRLQQLRRQFSQSQSQSQAGPNKMSDSGLTVVFSKNACPRKFQGTILMKYIYLTHVVCFANQLLDHTARPSKQLAKSGLPARSPLMHRETSSPVPSPRRQSSASRTSRLFWRKQEARSQKS